MLQKLHERVESPAKLCLVFLVGTLSSTYVGRSR
jgi:hypothetical protein